MKAVIFKGKGKQRYRFRVVADNGETMAQSEGYLTKWNARRAAKKAFPDKLIEDETEKVLTIGYKRGA